VAARYAANHGIQHFSAWNYFFCIAYSQLTRREGWRDLVACLNSQRSKLYHLGICGKISRSTLADANERRDWRFFEAFGHRLIATAVELYQSEDIGLEIREPLYALDSTTIDLCLRGAGWLWLCPQLSQPFFARQALRSAMVYCAEGALSERGMPGAGEGCMVNALKSRRW